jgi:hypothetical protein
MTLTTVGYCDLVPSSWLGKFFAGCCAISYKNYSISTFFFQLKFSWSVFFFSKRGIIVVAMPISLLTSNFSNAYSLHKIKERIIGKYYLKHPDYKPKKVAKKNLLNCFAFNSNKKTNPII